MDPVDVFLLCKSRDEYERLSPHIKPAVLTHTAPLFTALGDYYRDNPTLKSVDWSTFGTWFLATRSGRHKNDTLEKFRLFIDRLETAAAKSPSFDDIACHYVTVHYAAKIQDLCAKLIDGRADPSEIDAIGELVDDCVKEVGRATTVADLFASDDLTDLAKTVTSSGWEWRLEELNVSAGPLRVGDLVVVGARPESGKTTFLADQVSYMAEQMEARGEKRPILWVNNEEQDSKVHFRIKQAALGETAAAILADLPAHAARFDSQVGKQRFLVTKSDAGLNSVEQIDRLCREYNPCMIVFDQLDKVEGFRNAERDDLRLGRLYWWARTLAHKYGPVIAASQADGSADGVEYISDVQLRGSKTDKSGEADLIITIGNKKDPAHPNARGLHLPKNKLHGGARSDPAHRHGYWQVVIDPERARYEGTL